MRVTLDRHAAGVLLPSSVEGLTVLLDYGHGLVPAIPDLDIALDGIRATLSFAGVLTRTFVPWTAVRRVDPILRCALCGRSRHAVGRMVEGERGALCDDCPATALAVFEAAPSNSGPRFELLSRTLEAVIAALPPHTPFAHSTAALRAAVQLDSRPERLRALVPLARRLHHHAFALELVTQISPADLAFGDRISRVGALLSLDRQAEAQVDVMAIDERGLGDRERLVLWCDRAIVLAECNAIADAQHALEEAERLVASLQLRDSTSPSPLAGARMKIALAGGRGDQAVMHIASIDLEEPRACRDAGDAHWAVARVQDAARLWRLGLERAHPESATASSLRDRLTRTVS